MNFTSLKQSVLLNIKNFPGWSFNRKVVVFECDDYGGQRMPSREVWLRLKNADIPVDDGRFNQFDSLAGEDDLSALYEVLLSIKGSNGNPAVLTPICNLVNPDFKKIKESSYKQYFYEKFTDTLKRTNGNDRVFELWKKGMELGIFVPELHGREHIAVHFWLNALQKGDEKLRLAFDNEFVFVKSKDAPIHASSFRPEFFFNDVSQKEFLIDSIKDSVKLFNEIFGYKPRLFVPGNSIFHPDFEPVLASANVKFLNANRISDVPDGRGGLIKKYHRFGNQSESGIIHYIRNCAFEPTDRSYKNIDLTMSQIAAAFRWNKPAFISSHRVNFVGGLSVENRKKGLHELSLLLKAIVKRWPDVEFMSAGDLLNEMHQYNLK